MIYVPFLVKNHYICPDLSRTHKMPHFGMFYTFFMYTVAFYLNNSVQPTRRNLMWPSVTFETCLWKNNPDFLVHIPALYRRKILPT